MIKNIFKIILLLLLVLHISPVMAEYGHFDEYVKDISSEYDKPIIIPKGSFFRGAMGETVSSEFNNNGDLIKILINSDFIYDNQVVIPKNSLFIGQVTHLEKAQQGRNGMFSINIVGLIFPDESRFDVRGYIPAGKNDRIFGGEFARRSGHKTVVHRSACFDYRGYMQLLQSGPRVMGKETRLVAGELVTIVVEEPINIKD